MIFSDLLPSSFVKAIRNGIIFIALMSLIGCSTNPVSGKKDFSLINKDQELAMGAQAHRVF